MLKKSTSKSKAKRKPKPPGRVVSGVSAYRWVKVAKKPSKKK
jgi:hypothetical protein